MDRTHLKISAVVVTFNEGHLLAACLKSISFCDEIIVIDLGSSDNSVEIGEEYGAKIVTHPRVPVVEQIRGFALSQAKHDWVLLPDPDERVSPGLVPLIYQAIESRPKVGLIFVPCPYYFFDRPLTTTRWGVLKIKGLVVHKHRVTSGKAVHCGIQLKDGYEEFRTPYNEKHVLEHRWMIGYAALFEKHWRYLKQEGEAQYLRNRRFSLQRLMIGTFFQLKENLIRYRGLTGGWPGWFLSFFWAAFFASREVVLGIYQIRLFLQKHGGNREKTTTKHQNP